MNHENFKIFYTLTRHDPKKNGEWGGLQGRVDMNMLEQCKFPKPEKGTVIIICGPNEMQMSLLQMLLKAKYTQDQVILL